MKKLTVLLSIFISSVCSAFPMEDIYNNLDVTTFNSSFARKIPNGKINFKDISSIPKPVITDLSIIMEKDAWVYTIKAYKENGQGIHICFTDRAKKSKYNAQEPMIIRKYGDSYVALRSYTGVCEEYAR